MGVGILWLLEGIEKYGSIRKAAESMNLSYTKAHQMLKKLEVSLQIQILDRQRGGNARGGATLSESGKIYLDKYRVFHQKIEEYCNKEFELFRKEMEKESF